MAKPAFIYAFDNLEPERFTELCGELLGSRYIGFGFLVLGGVGPDGGIDAELDTNLAIWQPESEDALLNDIILSWKGCYLPVQTQGSGSCRWTVKSAHATLKLVQMPRKLHL